MRSRDRILGNLESIYREAYERAKRVPDEGRMIDLDHAFMRDQPMPQILRAWLITMSVAGLVSCRAVPDSSAALRPADLVVYGRVWTGDSTRPWAEAVAVEGEKIVAVGDSAEMARP